MTHPLKVLYKGGGIHYCMIFHTYDRQAQMVVARSLGGMFCTARKIAETHGAAYVSLLSADKINIVAPPDILIKEAIRREAEAKVKRFVELVTDALLEVPKNQRPSIFGKCKHRQRTDEYGSYSLYKQEETNPCLCINNFGLKNLTADEFYAQYFERWIQSFPKDIRIFEHNYGKGWDFSKASQATKVKGLWVARRDQFDGSISLLSCEEKLWYDLDALFYFNFVEAIDITEWQELTTAAIAKIKHDEKIKNKQFNLELKKEKQQYSQKVLSVFKE